MYKKKETTKTWLDSVGIKNYTINKNLTVDVNGDVDISDKSLSSIPVQFGMVKGYFSCAQNQLTSLLGAPKVANDFFCDNNQLTSLKYFPEKVVDNITCSFNQITSLNYLPKKIKGNLDCGYNPNLTSLNHASECFSLIAKGLKLDLKDCLDIKCKVFFHRAETEEEKIALLNTHYDEKDIYGFDLMIHADSLNNMIKLIKEKQTLENNIEPQKLTTKKLKV